MNRVYIKTYGCQMNERDSEAVSEMLLHRGYSIVSVEADADIILLNTCSIRDQSEQKAIGKAGHLVKLKQKKPNLVLGVLGCMAQNRGTELLDRLPDLDLIIGTQKFHRTPDHLDYLVSALRQEGVKPHPVVDLDDEDGSQNTINSHVHADGKVSAFVSIMQGCDMNCAFCIVPKTRGSERSRPMDHIVDEVKSLIDHGIKEITLLGQIVTSYGKNEYARVNGRGPFVQLLEKLHGLDGLKRIRFTSPHPLGFRNDLVNAFSELPKLGEYAHLPVQSGSDRILRAMNRPYSVKRYLRLIDDLRHASPHIHFSTDLIVGFPGETDNDFDLTLDLFKRVRFDMAFIFKYSERTGTIAAQLSQQVPQDIKESRHQILLEVLEQHSLRRNRSLVGSFQEILVEGPARKGKGMLMGRTKGYRKVVFPGKPHLVGQLVDTRITNATVTVLKGEIAPNLRSSSRSILAEAL
jgi:tRNA-2-methylthio-N6-dimethylallyladenosine synthase